AAHTPPGYIRDFTLVRRPPPCHLVAASTSSGSPGRPSGFPGFSGRAKPGFWFGTAWFRSPSSPAPFAGPIAGSPPADTTPGGSMAEMCGAPTTSGRPCRRPAGSCPSHGTGSGAGAGPVRRQVDRALTGMAEDWRTATARKLADAIDEEPNASTARELRALMSAIEATAPTTEATPLDELERRRQGRQANANPGADTGSGH